MARKTINVAYRFYVEDVECLKRLAARLGISQVQALRMAIRQFSMKHGDLAKTTRAMVESAAVEDSWDDEGDW